MFLRRHSRRKNDQEYAYWSLVKSVRTARGPRQQTVAMVGKLPGIDEEARVGWERIGEILDGRARCADFLRTPCEAPQWARVNLRRLEIDRPRRFGDVFLGLALWRRLGLDEFFDEALGPGREEVPWAAMACILTLGRFCAPSSELQIAEFWYQRTALDDLLGVSAEKVYDQRLYRALDAVLPHKDALFGHLQRRYGQWFGTTFDLLLYDVTSTYFEGTGAANAQAKRGYSRDGRADCVQVCIGLVVTPEGLPLGYEVFDGNRVDVTTVREIVEAMRRKYGQERRIWVMDRGMVSEDNLKELRGCGASYVVATPRSMLRRYERALLEDGWEAVESEAEVKLCEGPDGQDETFVLCRSAQRREKDRAIRRRQIEGIEKGLASLKAATERSNRPLRSRDQAHMRLGALLSKYSRAAHLYEVAIHETPDPQRPGAARLSIDVRAKEVLRAWAEESDGAYLLRTNLRGHSAPALWKIYTGLTQIEDCFRVAKHDLDLRPIYHHRQDRTQAHILICFLSLVLWRALQQWMDRAGLGTAPRKLLEEMAEVQSMDVLLPTAPGPVIRLRTVCRPSAHLAILLQRLDLPLPNKPRQIQNVVQTFSEKIENLQQTEKSWL